MNDLSVAQITQLTDETPRPRSMAFQAVLPQLQRELDAANKRITELTEALTLMNERQRQEWARAENTEAESEKLLAWSRQAYRRLNSLMTIGVSMTPDAVTAKLLEDAPADVSYSIYTDPLIVGIAKSMECTVGDLVEYATDSVGVSATKVEGCHSAGVHRCYGDLWTCVACKRTFCQAEGSTDMIELCNECWMKARAEEASEQWK